MVGGLVEIAAACERLWQSQSGMNLEFPPAPIPAGPMPDIASLRPWQILPPGSRPRITLAADANTESSVGWELGYGTSRTDHSLVTLRARDVRGGNSFERQTITDAAVRRLVSLKRATPRDRQQDRASYLLQNFLHQEQHPPDLSVPLVGLMHA